MYKLLFLDTETTGAGSEDRVCQIAYKLGDDIASMLYKPPLPIKPMASAVTHITNKMVADSPVFRTTGDYLKLQELANDPEIVFIAHNAPFDIEMMGREGVHFTQCIDTLKVVRHIDQGEYESHKLQYLRYFHDIELEASAHDALGDVLVLEAVFKILEEKLKILEPDVEDTIARMIEITKLPTLFKKITFGKYAGKELREVLKVDRPYLEWLLDAKKKNSEGEEDWIYTLTKILNG